MRLRVEPQAVCAYMHEGWWRPTLLAQTSRDIESASVAAQAEAMNVAMADLRETAPLDGARLVVEVADSFVHLDVAEGEFADHTDRQLQAVASACVSELLANADQHEVRWQLQSDERHLMICAMPRAQLQSIATLAATHGMRVAGLQADFSVQWNRHARSLNSGPAVFAVASQDDAVVACVDDGVISCVSSGQWLDADGSGTSRPQVERLLCSLGLDRKVTAGTLDKRVDRLLASIGREPQAQSAFVLVAPDISASALSSRWNVIDREAGPA